MTSNDHRRPDDSETNDTEVQDPGSEVQAVSFAHSMVDIRGSTFEVPVLTRSSIVIPGRDNPRFHEQLHL
jgi:hypothetical protein